MNSQNLTPRFLVLAGMIFIAAFSRLIPHPPNFTAVAAIAGKLRARPARAAAANRRVAEANRIDAGASAGGTGGRRPGPGDRPAAGARHEILVAQRSHPHRQGQRVRGPRRVGDGGGGRFDVVFNDEGDIVGRCEERVECLDMAPVAAILPGEHQATRVAAECGIVDCLPLCFRCQLAIDCRDAGQGQA